MEEMILLTKVLMLLVSESGTKYIFIVWINFSICYDGKTYLLCYIDSA